jgi:hypothetical protein
MGLAEFRADSEIATILNRNTFIIGLHLACVQNTRHFLARFFFEIKHI